MAWPLQHRIAWPKPDRAIAWKAQAIANHFYRSISIAAAWKAPTIRKPFLSINKHSHCFGRLERYANHFYRSISCHDSRWRHPDDRGIYGGRYAGADYRRDPAPE